MMSIMTFARNTLTPNTMIPIEYVPPLPTPPVMTLKRQLEALSEKGRYYDRIGTELALEMKFPTNLTH